MPQIAPRSRPGRRVSAPSATPPTPTREDFRQGLPPPCATKSTCAHRGTKMDTQRNAFELRSASLGGVLISLAAVSRALLEIVR
jgi:hypothetical protein